MATYSWHHGILVPAISYQRNEQHLQTSFPDTRALMGLIDAIWRVSTDGDVSGSRLGRLQDHDGRNWSGAPIWHGQTATLRYVAPHTTSYAYIVLKTLQILHCGVVHLAEVHFYFTRSFGGNDNLRTLALVSLYSLPNAYLLQKSHNTLAVCRHRGWDALVVIDVGSILSVVAMAPFPFLVDGQGDQYFLIEKIGLDIVDADPIDDKE